MMPSNHPLFLQKLRHWREEENGGTWFAYLLLFLWCLPLLLHSQKIGVLDWDWFASYFHVLRTTLVEHGQFPGYNPYMYLGSPLWANPQIGPLSHFTPFVLLFGPLLGLKLGILCSYWLSYEAGRALGRRLFESPQAAVLAGLLYALNTALAAHWVMGHICFVAYPLFPWLLLWCLKWADDTPSSRWAGLVVGLLTGLMIQMGLHYFVVYSLFFAGLLCGWLVFRHKLWAKMPRFGTLWTLGVVVVAGSRILPILQMMGDFPRKMSVPFALNFGALKAMFFTPAVSPSPVWLKIPSARFMLTISANEFYAYAGFGVLLLALVSLRRGIRWWHVGVLVSFLLMLGNNHPLLPSTWLSKFPVFSSMWMFLRWRMMVLIFLGISAAQGVDILWEWAKTQASPWPLRVSWVVVFLVVAELLVVLYPSWSKGMTQSQFPKVTRKQLQLKPGKHMLSVRNWKPTPKSIAHYYPLFRNNIGSAQGYEPLFGYLPARSIRRYNGHRFYKGEYIVGGQAVTPVYWSPNRIQFKGLPPGKALHINLNPGRGWSMNGEDLFVEWKTFELRKPFIVLVPPSGKVDLRYSPPGLASGFLLSLLALLGIVGVWGWEKKKGMEVETAQSVESLS